MLTDSKAAESVLFEIHIIMKYKIKGYQVIYSNGCRDKVNLEIPIVTEDKEAIRAKLIRRHTGLGIECKGVNLDYDELNHKSV